MKISVYKTKDVLVIAQNFYDREQVLVRHFDNQDSAANFLDDLAKED